MFSSRDPLEDMNSGCDDDPVLKRFESGFFEVCVLPGPRSTKVLASSKSVALSNLRKGGAAFVFVTCRGTHRGEEINRKPFICSC